MSNIHVNGMKFDPKHNVGGGYTVPMGYLFGVCIENAELDVSLRNFKGRAIFSGKPSLWSES